MKNRKPKSKKALMPFCVIICILFLLPFQVSYAEQGPVYTIGWMSDTQNYALRYPETFLKMTDYLWQNKDSMNLAYVVMTGDLVDNAQNIKQWKLAREAMDQLEDIPYGVLAGNHDSNKAIGFENYEKFFGQDVFEKTKHYGGSYKNNQNHFDLLTLGKTDYVFVYLSYQPGPKEISWANEVFANHLDRVGVLCVHDYLNKKGSLRPMGERLQREVVAQNPNIYLVLCGHKTAEKVVPITFENGDGTSRTVYQCIANYQSLEKGGGGNIRFIQVNEEGGLLRFYTSSPFLDAFDQENITVQNQNEDWPIPWKMEKYSYLVGD